MGLQGQWAGERVDATVAWRCMRQLILHLPPLLRFVPTCRHPPYLGVRGSENVLASRCLPPQSWPSLPSCLHWATAPSIWNPSRMPPTPPAAVAILTPSAPSAAGWVASAAVSRPAAVAARAKGMKSWTTAWRPWSLTPRQVGHICKGMCGWPGQTDTCWKMVVPKLTFAACCAPAALR